MSSLLRPIFALVLAGAASLRVAADAPTAASLAFLRPGETIELRLSYGIFGNAGTTRIETVLETMNGLPQYRVHVVTKSRGIVDSLYPVANDSESILDAATGRPLAIRIDGKAGSKPTRSMTVFDYLKGEVVHTDFIRPVRNGTAPLPSEPAYDLMVAMLQTRTWGLVPGQSRRVLCANANDFYTIEVTAIAEERVRTPAGTFDAVVLEPRQLGELKGFFRRGGSMKVWVSKGPEPQIVRLDTRTKAGTFTASLTRASVTPAAGATAVAASP